MRNDAGVMTTNRQRAVIALPLDSWTWFAPSAPRRTARLREPSGQRGTVVAGAAAADLADARRASRRRWLPRTPVPTARLWIAGANPDAVTHNQGGGMLSSMCPVPARSESAGRSGVGAIRSRGLAVPDAAPYPFDSPAHSGPKE